ncbi:MAG: ParB/RepB/Spo0J family partition protein [Nevskiaceae bacterium]|nr:MAG: ParB/RepB/Spo0J family partition protein [Nevskiaceae bacterium]
MSVKKRGLGRGLDALLSSVGTAPAAEPGDDLRELALDRLEPGRHQPRRHFDEAALTALADSIRAQGVVQPIVVRPAGADRYEIIAGERRWRAARIAGLQQIPAVVRSMDERSAMAVALVENIQRADLNPLEEAEALHKLIEECGLTHQQCAEAVGHSRATVSNLLRLMELNQDVQALVRDGKLSLGHAKVLLGVEGSRQSSLAKLVVDGQLSVRATESLVQAKPGATAKPAAAAPHRLEQELRQRIGLPVRLQQNDKGRGKLTVAFKNQAELDRLLQALR